MNVAALRSGRTEVGSATGQFVRNELTVVRSPFDFGPHQGAR